MQESLTLVLTQAQQDPGGQGEDFGKSSPVGLVLLILFGVAVAFLIRSMTKHLKKLPTSFDADKAASAAPVLRRRASGSADSADSATTDSATTDAEDGVGPAQHGDRKDGGKRPEDSGTADDGDAPRADGAVLKKE